MDSVDIFRETYGRKRTSDLGMRAQGDGARQQDEDEARVIRARQDAERAEMAVEDEGDAEDEDEVSTDEIEHECRSCKTTNRVKAPKGYTFTRADEELTMRHECLSCGGENEIAPPRGYRLTASERVTATEAFHDSYRESLRERFRRLGH